MNLGPLELGLILVIVLLIFGAGKLPDVFRSMGEGIREFRSAAGSEDEKKDEATAPKIEHAAK
jgi:sec-independent protein translocase protein TatA